MASPAVEFQQAIRAKSLPRACAQLAELPRITLVEAAQLLLLIDEVEPVGYEACTKRWISQLCLERPGAVGLRGIAQAAAALEILPMAPDSARYVLAEVLDAAGLPLVARVFTGAARSL